MWVIRLLEMLAYPLRRQPRGPLAQRRPGGAGANVERQVPLGMEALDLDKVAEVNRRNNALERIVGADANGHYTGFFAKPAKLTRATFPEDETYAARYHRAFQTKDDPK